MRRAYYMLDVFTETPLEGNPLAVVVDCEGLTGARMQAIAREFNLSKTVFVLDPRDPVNTARLRIFTPSQEIPFAGHPTIGAAVLIGDLRAREIMSSQDLGIVLEEDIGVISCTARHRKGRAPHASFTLPGLPQLVGELRDAGGIAAALGLHSSDIGFEEHRPTIWSAGMAFAFVPVASLEAIGRACANASLFPAAFESKRPAVFLYTSEVMREGSHVHARMFAPGMGISEDPATGSAVAAFAGVAATFERPDDGEHLLVIEQGFEMGRPSILHLRIDVVAGELASVTVGGSAVLVAQGTIEA